MSGSEWGKTACKDSKGCGRSELKQEMIWAVSGEVSILYMLCRLRKGYCWRGKECERSVGVPRNGDGSGHRLISQFSMGRLYTHVTHLAFRKKCHPFGEKRGREKKGICGRARTWSEITVLSLTILEY